MKTIGLLGGMSWVSTTTYYTEINGAASDRLGTEHCAPMMMWQVDFAEITAFQRAGDWVGAGQLLAAGATTLMNAGAEVLAICTNTMHLVSDAVEVATPHAQLVHIVDAVGARAAASGVTTIGLIGTAYTMDSTELYPPRLRSAGVEMIVPDADARNAIQRHTFEELVAGVVTEEAVETFRGAISSMIDAGANGIVLACTEHAAAVAMDEWPVPIIDSTKAHIDAILDAAW